MMKAKLVYDNLKGTRKILRKTEETLKRLRGLKKIPQVHKVQRSPHPYRIMRNF